MLISDIFCCKFWAIFGQFWPHTQNLKAVDHSFQKIYDIFCSRVTAGYTKKYKNTETQKLRMQCVIEILDPPQKPGGVDISRAPVALYVPELLVG